jgi:hypothetical protein
MTRVISLTSAGRLARHTCGKTIRRNVKAGVMPPACAASSWPRGKSAKEARQISAWKTEVLIEMMTMAAIRGDIRTPSAGSPKKMRSARVTIGVARMMLT